MHRHEGVVTDFDATVAIDHRVRTNENIFAENNRAAESLDHGSGIKLAARSELDATFVAFAKASTQPQVRPEGARAINLDAAPMVRRAPKGGA